MKAFNGLEIKKSVSASEPLPAGGYVAKILNAKVEEYSWGEVLVISFDIAEGEYKDFFSKQYKENTREDKKWKGNFRLTVPQESNQYFDSQKRTFGNAIWSIEESNPSFRWAWDENALKGKMVGVLFRNYEYDVDGRQGWSTECCTFVSVEDVRTGNFKQPKDKPLRNKTANNDKDIESNFSTLDDVESGLPF